MTTIEDKVSLFSKIIYDKVNEEKEERLEAFNKDAEKKVDMEKEKIEELRHSLQIEVKKKSNIKANRIVAIERLNKQREILFLKDKLIKEAIESVRVKLVEFVYSSEYKPYFISNLQKTLKGIDKGKYYIIVLKRDYEKFQSDIEVILDDFKDHNIELKMSEVDFIGGQILEEFEGKFKIVNTIDSELQECIEIIGVRVMEMLG